MSLPYKSTLIPRAKELRRNMTPQERRLWYDYLRSHAIRFQRQKAIAGYITDFYCHKAKLVIEIDGSQHYSEQAEAYDVQRTAMLEQIGLCVLRFTNRDIDERFSDVCSHIDITVHDRLSALRATVSSP